MEEFYQSFGKNIRKYRRMKRLNQTELGELTDMGRPTVASIEAGRQAVALHQAIRLARALSVELPQLLGESEHSQIHALQGLLRDHDFRIIEELHGELP